MHAVFTDGKAVTIWWNASATFRVYHYGRELIAFTNYGAETLADAQAIARDWYVNGGAEDVDIHLAHL